MTKQFENTKKSSRSGQTFSVLLDRQRLLIRELEDAVEDSGLGDQELHMLRFRLGRLSAEYLRLIDEASSSGIHNLTGAAQHRPESGREDTFPQTTAPGPTNDRGRLLDQAFAAGLPARGVILNILAQFGVPNSPLTVARAAKLLYERDDIRPTTFATLRRDERKSFRSRPEQNRVWIVAALDAATLERVPRLVARSDWEPERRIIGRHTASLNHYRTIIAIQQMIRNHPEQLQTFEKLALPHTKNLDVASLAGGDFIASMAESGRRELKLLEEEDRAERREAAARLKSLPEIVQLWGQD